MTDAILWLLLTEDLRLEGDLLRVEVNYPTNDSTCTTDSDCEGVEEEESCTSPDAAGEGEDGSRHL